MKKILKVKKVLTYDGGVVKVLIATNVKKVTYDDFVELRKLFQDVTVVLKQNCVWLFRVDFGDYIEGAGGRTNQTRV